jgi:hypothetical protein
LSHSHSFSARGAASFNHLPHSQSGFAGGEVGFAHSRRHANSYSQNNKLPTAQEDIEAEGGLFTVGVSLNEGGFTKETNFDHRRMSAPATHYERASSTVFSSLHQHRKSIELRSKLPDVNVVEDVAKALDKVMVSSDTQAQGPATNHNRKMLSKRIHGLIKYNSCSTLFVDATMSRGDLKSTLKR